jgi:hypothetical protein
MVRSYHACIYEKQGPGVLLSELPNNNAFIPSVILMVSKGDGFFRGCSITALFSQKKTRKKEKRDHKKSNHYSHHDYPLSSRMPREILIAPLSSIPSWPSVHKLGISRALIAGIDMFSSVFAAAPFHKHLQGDHNLAT